MENLISLPLLTMLGCFTCLFVYVTDNKEQITDLSRPVTQRTPFKTLYYVSLCFTATAWFTLDVTDILPKVTDINRIIVYRIIIICALSLFTFAPIIADTLKRDNIYRLCYFPVLLTAHILAAIWILNPNLFYYGSPLFNLSLIVVGVQILLAAVLLKFLFWGKY